MIKFTMVIIDNIYMKNVYLRTKHGFIVNIDNNIAKYMLNNKKLFKKTKYGYYETKYAYKQRTNRN